MSQSMPSEPVTNNTVVETKSGAGAKLQLPYELGLRLNQIYPKEQLQLLRKEKPDIPMEPFECSQVARDLTRTVMEMEHVSRNMSEWYTITRDDRLKIEKQFADDEEMRIPKDNFSILSWELYDARTLFESMANDLVIGLT
ncbi:unnamed protein product [Fusarium venenatum]|uniref:Uncharacterized protein n=1 Tax=Fusarium venenatum TaxID=56646 RepID=A0A2L2TV86_9HYPO|nr:uncharacterized protein FVRRES_10668 [Fusarium venenatum]CEI70591.1 unnamed protein product [Fusarium venenatum]